MTRIIKKVEAPFTTKLEKWMLYNMKFTYGWEVKYPKENKYYFSGDKSFKKELNNLLNHGKTFIYKHSDASGFGTPCDGYTMWKEPGYFFFTWNGKDFYVIECFKLKEFTEHNKYLTEDDAIKISEFKSRLGEIIKNK